MVLLDPDQLLAEVLYIDDDGEEPVAVKCVALTNIQQQLLIVVLLEEHDEIFECTTGH